MWIVPTAGSGVTGSMMSQRAVLVVGAGIVLGMVRGPRGWRWVVGWAVRVAHRSYLLKVAFLSRTACSREDYRLECTRLEVRIQKTDQDLCNGTILVDDGRLVGGLAD